MQQQRTILYTAQEAAQMLRTNARTMERWRTTGEGPTYIKVGRRVAYRLSDLEAWIETQARQHTQERVA